MSITRAQVRKIALSFPGVTQKAAPDGNGSYHLGKRFFTWIRREENSLVARTGSIDERDMLIESEPVVFHITEHYRNYPAVLVRLDQADPGLVRDLLDRHYRSIAPKKLLKEYDQK